MQGLSLIIHLLKSLLVQDPVPFPRSLIRLALHFLSVIAALGSVLPLPPCLFGLIEVAQDFFFGLDVLILLILADVSDAAVYSG
jgi:hypothetical protein